MLPKLISLALAILFTLLILSYYSRPKRHLIYICFKGQDYFQIAQFLISSIDINVTRNDVDVLIRADAETIHYVNLWFSKYKKDLVNQNIQYKLHSSTLDMHNYRYEINDTFHAYDKILYLDTDILIANENINKLFDEPLHHNTLYVVHESTDFNKNEWAFTQYTNPEIYKMMNHNVFPFNNGQFIFRYSPSMKTHFANVIKLSKSVPYNPFIDQQSMNHYFNTRLLTNGTVLNHYTKLFATDTYTPQSKECIMHFSGNIHKGDWKLNIMKRFLANQKGTKCIGCSESH